MQLFAKENDMRRIFVVVSLIVVMLIFAGCQSGSTGGGTPAPQSTAELKQALGSGKKTVVFFLNPQGGPCRAQNEILTKLYQDRGGNFNIAYVSTMKPEDQQAFYDYGVRNLPTLVLVDSSGKISQNFPPGIQTYETLAASLDRIR
jgi:thioredoxin 1